MISIATVVPFAYLDDLISSGILIAFTMTDTSVILVRQTSPPGKPCLLEKYLATFHILSLLSGFLLRNCLSIGPTGNIVRLLTPIACIGTWFVGSRIRTHCPSKNNDPSAGLFLTPFMPVLPLCGCFVSSNLDVFHFHHVLVIHLFSKSMPTCHFRWTYISYHSLNSLVCVQYLDILEWQCWFTLTICVLGMSRCNTSQMRNRLKRASWLSHPREWYQCQRLGDCIFPMLCTILDYQPAQWHYYRDKCATQQLDINTKLRAEEYQT